MVATVASVCEATHHRCFWFQESAIQSRPHPNQVNKPVMLRTDTTVVTTTVLAELSAKLVARRASRKALAPVGMAAVTTATRHGRPDSPMNQAAHPTHTGRTVVSKQSPQPPHA